MTTILGPNNYGKSRVRLVRVARHTDRHDIADLTVDVALAGDFAAAHIADDNAGLLATDTMRNTVYALARGFDVSDLSASACGSSRTSSRRGRRSRARGSGSSRIRGSGRRPRAA